MRIKIRLGILLPDSESGYDQQATWVGGGVTTASATNEMKFVRLGVGRADHVPAAAGAAARGQLQPEPAPH